MATKFTLPGIQVNEVDLSEVVEPAGTSTGAIVGKTNKGPVNTRIAISNDKQFLDVFGEPTAITDYAHQAALIYSQEAPLVFVRASFGDEYYANKYVNSLTTALGSSAANATSAASISATKTTDLIKVDLYSDGNTITSQNGEPGIYDLEFAPTVSGAEWSTGLVIGSVGPGIYGNDVGFSIITCADGTPNSTSAVNLTDVENGFDWAYAYDDPEANGTPSSATDAKWKKVYRVNVYVKPTGNADSYWGNGTATAISATSPVETFLVSNSKIKDAAGASLYAPDVINGSSNYIYVKPTDNTVPASVTTIQSLVSGADGSSSTAGDKQSAWTLFSDKQRVDVDIMLIPDEPNSSDVQTIIDVAAIAAKRQDAIAVGQIGTKSDLKVSQILTKQESYTISEPSYVALYAGYVQKYEKFLDQKIYVPNAIYGATLMARTDRLANTWSAPAGLNRGLVPSIGVLKKYTDSEIGTLYNNNINTTKFVRGQGNVMWGQKTAQRKKSALQNINVRRLLLYVESSLEPTLLNFLFELNTDKTRSRVFSVVDGFMSTVLAGGGVTDYQVVCNESNNTSETIDNGELVIDLALQPTRVIEYISLNVIVTRTGISFAEVF